MLLALMLAACSTDPDPPPTVTAPPALAAALEPVAPEPAALVDTGRGPIGFVTEDGSVVDELPEPEEPEEPEEPVLTPEEVLAEAAEILAGLRAVTELGNKMHRLRFAGDSGDCRNEQGRAQVDLGQLRGRTEVLPERLGRYIVAVINDLDICTQCDGTAATMCEVSRSTMRTAQRAVDTWVP